MKKIISATLLTLFILSSCTKADIAVVTQQEKTPFYITTKSVWKKTESYSVEKPARLTAGSSLTLAAESMGEITSIAAKEWQKIRKWTKLVTLKDTVNSYDIRLAQAKNGLSVQDATLESSKISLDRAISDSQIAYEQAKRSYDTLIAKNPLVYDALVNTNQKTIDNLDSNYKLYVNDLDKNLDNMTYEADKVLGISVTFQYQNDGFESQLGARIGGWLKWQVDNAYSTALSYLWQVRASKTGAMTPDNATAKIAEIEKGYLVLRDLIDKMIYMDQNNAIGGSLTQSMNDGWITQWNAFRAALQASETAFIQWKNTTLTFLKNYKTDETATKLALDTLDRELTDSEKAFITSSSEAKVIYSQTRIDLKDRIKSAELALKQAETARDVALKSRWATISQLSANRNGTVLSIEQAQRDYSKLTVTAPFDGTVTKVLSSVGQRTNIGTALLEVVSNSPEILIDLDKDVASNLLMGDTLQVKVEDKYFTGTVMAISQAASSNLLYTTRISVPDATGNIGSAATVVFTFSKEQTSAIGTHLAIPLKSIKVLSEQQGELALLWSGNTVTYKTVKLWKLSWENIEIDELLDPSLEIILTDVSNFDKEKYILTKKWATN